ncbi:hypothetical protein LSH36_146g00025 [Paralvinella palmiformis]|uniref:E3 ubiquitin-protein ligase listerin n=1 Tax=Paralvinella palmiformis TaxID=53620 RepID=A0AAD9JWJ2_9ANNE|nr:hypothetical protein LSH36_146g00025 [Paralvinella palmiformis]
MCSELKMQTFAVTAFHLLERVAQYLSSTIPMQQKGANDNLVTEWLEFFSEGIYSLLLPLFVEVAGGIHTTPGPSTNLMLISLSSAVSWCPVPHLRQNSLPVKLIAEDECHLPESYQTTLNHLCPLLLNPNRSVQLTSYKLLLSLMPELSQYDDKLDIPDEDDKPMRSPPIALMTSLLGSSQDLNSLLHDVPMGEHLVIDIESDEYVITMGYLLSWQLLLALFRGAKVELRAEYAQYLRNCNLVEVLLEILYKILPENPVLPLCDASVKNKEKPTNTRSMFEEEPLLDARDARKEVDLLHMSCAVYFHALQDLPALIRHWYNSIDKRMSMIANRYTTKYVSPVLCNLEIRAVQDANVKLDNMTIKTRPAAREVAATYTVEELTMELVVTLPNNHPLGQITVECGKRIGVATAQWRNWMLQLTTFLHRQNGSILDGLTLWRRNVNKSTNGSTRAIILHVRCVEICFS